MLYNQGCRDVTARIITGPRRPAAFTGAAVRRARIADMRHRELRLVQHDQRRRPCGERLGESVSRQTAGPDCVPVTNRNKKGGCLPAVYQIGSANFID
jgi:hypothetical protein